MTVKEATRHLLKQLETIGWKVTRGRKPTARYGERVICFLPRSIYTIPHEQTLPSAKHYVWCLNRLLLELEPLDLVNPEP